jgi:DNA-binding NarL/FixJ family response regulator
VRASVVLADDHPLVLSALQQLLEAEPGYRVAAKCLNGREALQAVREHQPDLLVLDLRMPEMGALDVLRALNEERRPVRTVILTAALGEDEVLEALRLGARGVVLKDMAPRLLLQCLQKVLAGEQWLEKESVGRALEKLFRREAASAELSSTLTARELEVVRLVAGGLRNKEIAETLSITVGTVKLHLHRIYQKLAVDGRVELTILAREKGLL